MFLKKAHLVYVHKNKAWIHERFRLNCRLRLKKRIELTFYLQFVSYKNHIYYKEIYTKTTFHSLLKHDFISLDNWLKISVWVYILAFQHLLIRAFVQIQSHSSQLSFSFQKPSVWHKGSAQRKEENDNQPRWNSERRSVDSGTLQS